MKFLIDLQYFSPSIFYKKVSQHSNIIFEQYENYLKMSFHNRCFLAGANGPITLSIPLEKGRNQHTLIKDVRIFNREAWQARHWKTITSCYNRSPWFEFYMTDLELLYQKRFEFLKDWNLACLEWMMKQLGYSPIIDFTDGYQTLYDGSAYSDWRNKILPKTIHLMDNPVLYRQVFHDRLGFIPHLSVLDLLFCEGKNASRILSMNENH